MATKKPKVMTPAQAKMLGLKETKTAFGTAYTTPTSIVSGVPKTTTTKTSGGGGHSGGGGSSTPTPSPTVQPQLVSTPTGVITEQKAIAQQQTAQRQQQFIAQVKAKQQSQPKFQPRSVPRQQPTSNQPTQEQLEFQRKVDSGEYKPQFRKEGTSPYANPKKVYVDSSGQVVGEEVKVEEASTQPTNIPFVKFKENFYGGVNTVKENPVGKIAGGVGKVVTNPAFVNIGGVITAKEIKDNIQKNSVTISKMMDVSLLNTITGKRVSENRINARAFMIRMGAEFIPTTPLDVAIIGSGAGFYSKLPKVIRVGVSAITTGIGVYGATNTRLSPEQRVASGLIGGAGAFGFAFETYPYFKGAKIQVLDRIKGTYSPTKISKVSETFYNSRLKDYQFLQKRATTNLFQKKGTFVKWSKYPANVEYIKAVKIQGKAYDIGIIQKGGIRNYAVGLEETSPLRVGAFNKAFKQSRKIGYDLEGGKIGGTSQRNLFISKQDIVILPEKPFYVSPQKNIPLLRKSRLAMESLTESSKNIEIGWGKPTSSEAGFGYNLKGFRQGTTAELEEVMSLGTITGVKRVGGTTMKGWGVDLFEFTTAKGKSFIGKQDTSLSRESVFVSGEGYTSVLGTRTTRTFILSTTTQPIKLSSTTTKPTTTNVIPTQSIIPDVFKPTKPTRRSSGGTTTTGYSNPPSPIPPTITTYKNPPTKSIITIPRGYKTPPPKKPPIAYKEFKNPKLKFKSKPKSIFGKFAVSLRRFGKFKVVGYGKTPEQAFDIGKKQATNTLGATFKLEGYQGKPFKTFGFKTKSTKKGILYIEEPKFRLSKPTEKKEINYYKGIRR